MQRFKFFIQSKTMIKEFFRKSLGILFSFNILKIFKSAAHFHKNFTFSSLNNEIWICQFTNMQKPFSTALPSKNLFSAISRHLFSGVQSFVATKMFMNPFNKNFVRGRNSNITLIMFVFTSFAFTVIPNCEAAFSVKNSSHVGTNKRRMFFSYVNSIWIHMNKFVVNVCRDIYYKIKKIYVQPERLSPEGFFDFSKRQAIVRTKTIYKILEGGITRLPAIERWYVTLTHTV